MSASLTSDALASAQQLAAQLHQEREARQRAEQELAAVRRELLQQQHSTTRLQGLVQQLPMGTVLLNDADVVEQANEAFCRLFGLPETPRLLHGLTWAQLAQHITEHLTNPDQAVLAPATTAWQLALKDGRILECTQVRTDAPTPGRLVCYRDVTGQIQALEQATGRRDFYESVLQHIPADIVVFDAQHRYQFINPQAIQSPKRREWLLGRDDFDYCEARKITPNRAIERREQFLKAVDTRRSSTWEETNVHPDGRLEHIMRNLHPVFDAAGQLQMVVGYAFDVSAMRRAEQTLIRSEKQYRDLIQYSHALICTHDLEGHILSVNPALAVLLNYLPEEMIGLSLQEIMPADSAEVLHQYLRQFANRREASDVLTLLPRGSQEPRHLLYHNRRIEEAEQAPYVIVYAHDITDRILAERELRQARETAEKALSTRESFLASMSHEMRTPLQGILGMADLLTQTPLSETQRKHLMALRTAARHLSGTLNDVLDLANVTAGQVLLSEAPFRLDESIEHTVQLVMPQATIKGLGLLADIELVPALTVQSDPHRLTQVLRNLLNRAIICSSTGDVRLQVEPLAETPTTITVRFCVRDNSSGVLPEHIDYLFDPAAVSRFSEDRRFGSAGWSLSVSCAVVSRLGGYLQLCNEPGLGTTFGFTLTLNKVTLPAPAPKPAPVQLPEHALRGLRVLVVEPSETTQQLVQYLLQRYGAKADCAGSGAIGLTFFDLYRYDAVLLSAFLPDLTLPEITDSIRQHPDPVRAQALLVHLTAAASYTVPATDSADDISADALQLLRRLQTLAHAGHLPQPDAKALFDLSGLERMSGGSRDFVARVLSSFLTHTPPAMHALLRAADTADWTKVAAVAARIKPTLKVLGVGRLNETITTLENAERAPAETRQTALADMQRLIPSLLAELRTWQHNAGFDTTPLD